MDTFFSFQQSNSSRPHLACDLSICELLARFIVPRGTINSLLWSRSQSGSGCYSPNRYATTVSEGTPCLALVVQSTGSTAEEVCSPPSACIEPAATVKSSRHGGPSSSVPACYLFVLQLKCMAFFEIGVLPSSSGGQIRALTIASTVFKASGASLTNNS